MNFGTLVFKISKVEKSLKTLENFGTLVKFQAKDENRTKENVRNLNPLLNVGLKLRIGLNTSLENLSLLVLDTRGKQRIGKQENRG